MTGDGSARRRAAEAIGTFFLVFIGPGAVMVDAYSGGAIGHAGIALAFAFVVMAMIYALGHLSGAHINPAVTIAFWSVGRFPRAEVVPYIAAQCIGAAAASGALRAALGPVGRLGATLPRVPTGSAFLIEWLLSFGLMLVIMAVATDERVADGFAALAVGATVGFCALMGGPVTGASMNPARSLGPALVGGLWDRHWLYWVAPVTGMAVAAHTYDLLRAARPPATRRRPRASACRDRYPTAPRRRRPLASFRGSRALSPPWWNQTTGHGVFAPERWREGGRALG